MLAAIFKASTSLTGIELKRSSDTLATAFIKDSLSFSASLTLLNEANAMPDPRQNNGQHVPLKIT